MHQICRNFAKLPKEYIQINKKYFTFWVSFRYAFNIACFQLEYFSANSNNVVVERIFYAYIYSSDSI